MSDTLTSWAGSPVPSSNAASNQLSQTPSPLRRVGASAGKCDICDRRNMNHTMHRCSKCRWQTCHGECALDQGCSYGIDGHKCVHKCPMVNHSRANSDRSEAQHRQRHGSRRGTPATVQASESQVSPPANPTAAPSGQDLGESSSATTHRHDTDTIPVDSDRHEPNSNRKYMPIGARRLYALAWEALINEVPGLHGDGTEDPHGYALAEAPQALEDYKKSLLAAEDEHWEDDPSRD